MDEILKRLLRAGRPTDIRITVGSEDGGRRRMMVCQFNVDGREFGFSVGATPRDDEEEIKRQLALALRATDVFLGSVGID